MNITTRTRKFVACIALVVMLPLLAACGGGGGEAGGAAGGGGTATQPRQGYQMWKCTIYRRVDGFTGIEFWSKWPNENWRLKAGQPVFTSLADCEAAINVLKNSDPVIYDNSKEDRDRRWAIKLLCFEPDKTPPTILSVSPANESTGFPIDGSRLRAEFSDNMDSATVTTSSFTLEDSAGTLVPGTVIYSYEQRTAVFTADEPLQYVTSYMRPKARNPGKLVRFRPKIR